MLPLSLFLLFTLSSFRYPAGPVADRWRVWPVTRVFPYAITGTSPSGAQVTYLLAGIAPETSCAAAFRAAPPACVTALRATYADSTATFVATAGIAVLARPVPLGTAARVTVRPVAFPGPAEHFGERQCFTGARLASDAYLVATVAGYADGRSYHAGARVMSRLGGLARQLATALHRGLTE